MKAFQYDTVAAVLSDIAVIGSNILVWSLAAQKSMQPGTPQVYSSISALVIDELVYVASTSVKAMSFE